MNMNNINNSTLSKRNGKQHDGNGADLQRNIILNANEISSKVPVREFQTERKNNPINFQSILNSDKKLEINGINSGFGGDMQSTIISTNSLNKNSLQLKGGNIFPKNPFKTKNQSIKNMNKLVSKVVKQEHD